MIDWQRIWNDDGFDSPFQSDSEQSSILCSLLYRLIVNFRNRLYDRQILKPSQTFLSGHQRRQHHRRRHRQNALRDYDWPKCFSEHGYLSRRLSAAVTAAKTQSPSILFPMGKTFC
ncbi:MAG: hypothetical protein MZV70_09725 [Desulfobacterales bacterium]|nr:hypothetical protein [Desulfobacterales bacterium]